MSMIFGPTLPPPIKLDSTGHLIPLRNETNVSLVTRTAQVLWSQKMTKNDPTQVVQTYLASGGS